MSPDQRILKSKFADVLGWKRRKRHEQLLLWVGCVAVGAALLLLPFHVFLNVDGLRWFVPLLLFALLLPSAWFAKGARQDDPTPALTGLDKELRLEERAVTAFDLIERRDASAAAELVYQQAEEKLRGVDPRALFPRRWSLPAYLILPLCALWSVLLWSDFDRSLFEPRRLGAPAALAQALREFARELEEKAKNEGLQESQRMARELERIAQKSLDAKSDEQQLRKEVAGAAKQFDTRKQTGTEPQDFTAGASRQNLRDLKAELEAAKDMLNFSQGADASRELTRSWLDRLASMPQLNRQLGREQQQGQGFGQGQLQDYLNRMEQQVTAEMDRRTLIDAQQYLEQMMQQGPGKQGEQKVAAAGKESRDEAQDGEKGKSAGSRPGTEPGQKDESLEPLPPRRGGASAQVKGQLGAGESSGIVLKGTPAPGKSKLSQQEIVANYRRQAEQELNSERVPEALKDTIKNYFLTLGEEGKR